MSEDIVQVENDKAALIFTEMKTAQILHTVCSILLCLHGQRSPKTEAVLIKAATGSRASDGNTVLLESALHSCARCPHVLKTEFQAYSPHG